MLEKQCKPHSARFKEKAQTRMKDSAKAEKDWRQQTKELLLQTRLRARNLIKNGEYPYDTTDMLEVWLIEIMCKEANKLDLARYLVDQEKRLHRIVRTLTAGEDQGPQEAEDLFQNACYAASRNMDNDPNLKIRDMDA